MKVSSSARPDGRQPTTEHRARAGTRRRYPRGRRRLSAGASSHFWRRRWKTSTRSTSRSGLRDFDPALHQPHPPGYPVYMAAGHISLADRRTPDLDDAVRQKRGRLRSGRRSVAPGAFWPPGFFSWRSAKSCPDRLRGERLEVGGWELTGVAPRCGRRSCWQHPRCSGCLASADERHAGLALAIGAQALLLARSFPSRRGR